MRRKNAIFAYPHCVNNKDYMIKNIRFLDTDKWQGIYIDGKLILESCSQDIGEIVFRLIAQSVCSKQVYKSVYMPNIIRCPELWTEELEKKAK